MLPEPIPASFLIAKTILSPSELRWGLENGVIGGAAAVEVAGHLLNLGVETGEVLELAGLAHFELTRAAEIAERIESDRDTEERAHRKWVWVVLSWVYEEHHEDADVLNIIDALYADLGYPEEMVPFGPYPPGLGSGTSPNEVQVKVIQEWKRYLERGEGTYGTGNARLEETIDRR